MASMGLPSIELPHSPDVSDDEAYERAWSSGVHARADEVLDRLAELLTDHCLRRDGNPLAEMHELLSGAACARFSTATIAGNTVASAVPMTGRSPVWCAISMPRRIYPWRRRSATSSPRWTSKEIAMVKPKRRGWAFPRFVCLTCSKTFPTLRAMLLHRQQAHGSQPTTGGAG